MMRPTPSTTPSSTGPLMDRLIDRSAPPSLTLTVTLGLALFTAAWAITGAATGGGSWVLRAVVFAVVLVVPPLIAAASAAFAQRPLRDRELLKLTSVTPERLLWGTIRAALYRARFPLALLIGVGPLLARELAFAQVWLTLRRSCLTLGLNCVRTPNPLTVEAYGVVPNPIEITLLLAAVAGLGAVSAVVLTLKLGDLRATALAAGLLSLGWLVIALAFMLRLFVAIPEAALETGFTLAFVLPLGGALLLASVGRRWL